MHEPFLSRLFRLITILADQSSISILFNKRPRQRFNSLASLLLTFTPDFSNRSKTRYENQKVRFLIIFKAA